jgi:hypothetical protein
MMPCVGAAVVSSDVETAMSVGWRSREPERPSRCVL